MEFVRLLAADDFVAARWQAVDPKLHLTVGRGLGLEREEEPLLIGGPLDGLFFGEACACQFEIYLLAGCTQV